MLIYVTLGHLVYDFGTVKNRGTEKIEPNRTGTERGTETGTVPPLVMPQGQISEQKKLQKLSLIRAIKPG